MQHSIGSTPAKVTLRSQHGGVKLALPRDYVGPLLIRMKHGKVEPLPSRCVLTSDVGGERKYFVGDVATMGAFRSPPLYAATDARQGGKRGKVRRSR